MGKISSLRFLLSVFGSGVALARLLTSLLLIWLTFSWRVRKTRKAFEKELIKQGMAKRDAERISAQFVALKDSIENAFKQSLRSWR
jgi:type VI protein secretion system component VasK